jgi:hypothetical protein
VRADQVYRTFLWDFRYAAPMDGRTVVQKFFPKEKMNELRRDEWSFSLTFTFINNQQQM